jgi:predicted deacylase
LSKRFKSTPCCFCIRKKANVPYCETKFHFWGDVIVSSLYEKIVWTTRQAPSHAATGRVDLYVGEVGTKGPVATLVAGVHGDEGPWGALALQKLLARDADMLQGRLRVVLAANPLALEADARNAPLDQLDLNRTFPGDPRGSHTQVLATLLRDVFDGSSLVADLHGGGSWCVNAFVFSFPGSEELAAEVGAPFIVSAPETGGTLTQLARSRGARVVAIEMGGRSSDEFLWRDRIADGLARVLQSQGFLTESGALGAPASIPVGDTDVLRPHVGGLFVPTLREAAVGTVVEYGTELGRLLHPHTLEPIEAFHAPFARTALLLLRPHVCILEGGAMTYVVAEPR